MLLCEALVSPIKLYFFPASLCQNKIADRAPVDFLFPPTGLEYATPTFMTYIKSKIILYSILCHSSLQELGWKSESGYNVIKQHVRNKFPTIQ